MSETRKAVGCVSKKLYNEFVTVLDSKLNDSKLTDEIKEAFKTIFKFDPEASTYNQEKKEQIMRSRKKRAEELGVSMYVTGGSKAAYYKRKQAVEVQA